MPVGIAVAHEEPRAASAGTAKRFDEGDDELAEQSIDGRASGVELREQPLGSGGEAPLERPSGARRRRCGRDDIRRSWTRGLGGAERDHQLVDEAALAAERTELVGRWIQLDD